MKKTDAADLSRSVDQRKAWVYVSAIIVVAAVLRLFHLGAESLWIDEGFSLRDATNFSFIHETRPLYFFFLHNWLKLGTAHSEFLLRLPSAIFGTLGVWVLYLVGRRLMGWSVAALASLFMAISVLHINHSDEVRWYSLIVLLTLLSTYFLMLSIEQGRARYVATYALFSLASVLTFPLSVFTLAAQGLFALFYVKAYRGKSLTLLGLQTAAVLVWMPWMHNNTRTARHFSEGYTSLLDKPDPANITGMLGRFFLWKWSNPGHMQEMAAFGFSLLVLLVALYGLKSVRRTDAGAVYAWMWLVVPMAITVGVCYSVANIWMQNYLICASPALFLLVSRGIHSIRSKHLAVALTLVIVMITFGRLGMYFQKPARPQWRSAIQYVQSREEAGDVIGIYDPGNQYVFRYYYHGRAPFAPMGEETLDTDRLKGWTDQRVQALLSQYPNTGRRFWLVLSNHTYAGGFNIIGYMQRHYRVLDHQNYHLVELYLFDAGGRPMPVEAHRLGRRF